MPVEQPFIDGVMQRFDIMPASVATGCGSGVCTEVATQSTVSASCNPENSES